MDIAIMINRTGRAGAVASVPSKVHCMPLQERTAAVGATAECLAGLTDLVQMFGTIAPVVLQAGL